MNQEAIKLQEEFLIKFPKAKVFKHNERRLYISVTKEQIFDVAAFLYKEKHLRLSIATGIDTREGFEILYHFSYDKIGTYFTIKTLLPKDNPKIKSLAPIYTAANWIEREMHELLGIDFEGHPNLKPLLTSDDWPEEKYPLRRDYE
jgi:NADH:ubiquinone oxidoreductase subunit C